MIEKLPDDDPNFWDNRFDEIETNMHTKLSAHQKDVIRKGTKVGKEMEERIIKAFPDMPGQWLAAAMSILFNISKDLLDVADILSEEKNHVRTSVLAQTARILSMVDHYPDLEKHEEFHWKSHNDIMRYISDESKKWLT